MDAVYTKNNLWIEMIMIVIKQPSISTYFENLLLILVILKQKGNQMQAPTSWV